MYLVGFVLFVVLGRFRARKSCPAWHPRDVDDMLFYGVLGVILGGRLGYVLFYKPQYYLAHPLEIFTVWKGGMSFHGGFLGVLVALWLFARARAQALARGHGFRRAAGAARPRRRPPRQLHQRRAVGAARRSRRAVGDGVSAGGDSMPRHPSQLYQFALEGRAAVRDPVVVLAQAAAAGRGRRRLFLVGYGVLRFIAEYAREPDSFLGLLALGLSMGQWLSLPMIVIGAALMVYFTRTPATAQPASR